MIIAPQKSFLVDFKVNNPSDTATHYVQAVIKNSISRLTLATLNLTDNGSGYFSKEWVTPGDPTGTGLQITIFRTVYDDPTYATQSLIYGGTAENYIVRDLAGSRGILNGGLGASVDYKKIEKMIQQSIAEIDFPEIPKQKEVKFDDLEDTLKTHIETVAKNNDTSEEIAEVKQLIQLVTQTIKTEFSNKLIVGTEKVSELKKLPAEFHDLVSTKTKDHLNEIAELKKFVIEKFNDLDKKINDTLSKPVKIEAIRTIEAFRTKEETKPREAVLRLTE